MFWQELLIFRTCLTARFPVSLNFIYCGRAECLRFPGGETGHGFNKVSTTGFLDASPVQVPTSILEAANLIILSALHFWYLRQKVFWQSEFLLVWVCSQSPELEARKEVLFLQHGVRVVKWVYKSIKIFQVSRSIAMIPIEQDENHTLKGDGPLQIRPIVFPAHYYLIGNFSSTQSLEYWTPASSPQSLS